MSDLFERCIEIACEAGEKIMEIYKTDFGVETKSDDSPLTQADLAAHRCIVAGLQQLDPEIPVLSEEGRALDYATRKQWTRYWLVDPLDGTKEFIKKNDEFTVNIALIDNGVPVMGVVHAPALKITYAGNAAGAIKISDGARQAIACRKTADEPTLVVSRSHQDEALQKMLAGIGEHQAVSRGSSLKFCIVAEAGADLYPRTGPTSEWDTAAGQAVVEAAGGQVLKLDDWQPLRYNQKESLLNPGFAVIGEPAYGWPDKLAG